MPVDTDTLRTSDEIARRSLALYAPIAAAHGVPKGDLAEWLKEEKLWGELTPRELRFLTQAEPPEKERIWMIWFGEAEYTLLWSIGKIESLPLPKSKCDTDLIIGAIPLWQSTASFIHSAVLKEVEVRQEAERIYDIRVDIGKELRRGVPPPDGYDKDVAFFRHYALNWVIGYCGQSWDEITPDI